MEELRQTKNFDTGRLNLVLRWFSVLFVCENITSVVHVSRKE